jgi:hypothetical protein
MKVSFDWDSTLAEPRIQKLAKKFIDAGHEVYITTSRTGTPLPHANWDNKIIFTIAERLGIPKENIRFTNYVDKWEFLQGFDIHFDDDPYEIQLIEENIDCVGVIINDFEYHEEKNN